MARIRSEPCNACPYRSDVPSGVWAVEEYEKLAEYAKPGVEGSFQAFACHATPDSICCGWAVACAEEDSIALRLGYAMNQIEGPVPEPRTELMGHQEACDHGKDDIENPSDATRGTVIKLMRKHERLRDDIIVT